MVACRIGDLNESAVSVVGGGEHISASIGNGCFPAERIVAIMNGIVQRILNRNALIQGVKIML